MMACGVESCVCVCVILVRQLVRLTTKYSTMSGQTERSKLGLLTRAVDVRHESQIIHVVVLSFSYGMFVHWRAPVLQPTGPMSRGWAAAWTLPDPLSSQLGVRQKRTSGVPAQPGPAGISRLAQQRPQSCAFL